ncbi:MAG: AAA family ATPase [Euryarchaeota archaeon]|nr:AAA family ATPase [Euryarchaeota archaeon]MDE1837750.1 AAA family ATPase [Euryarchaeota archaeon]MDE1881142.1 AAA family ATPase [Euryarchaeota archaeon]MDE2045428.1 AAA family ATPase [Thermoplasmata archaeon]
MAYGGQGTPPNQYRPRPQGQVGNPYDVMGGFFPVSAPGARPPPPQGSPYAPVPARPGYPPQYRPVPVRPPVQPYPAGGRPPPGALAVPPRGGPPQAGRPPAPKKKKGYSKEEMVFIALGIGLILVGGFLIPTFNLLMNVQSAGQFIANTNAGYLPNSGTQAIQLTAGTVQPGQTIMIMDQIATIKYLPVQQITTINYTSISPQDNQHLDIAQKLFGVFSGNLQNQYNFQVGQYVLLTFKVVSATVPGNPNGSSYLTLDAAWQASWNAFDNSFTGLKAFSLDPAVIQPYPAPLYDGLFVAMIVAGAGLLLVAMMWPKRLKLFFKISTKDPQHLVPVVMFFLSILCMVFLPFYPWWMVLIFSVLLAFTAHKMPQLAVILLGMLMLAEVGYQAPELALIFVFGLLPLLGATLVDWRIGLGGMFVIALAPYGLSFIVPIMMAMIFSLMLGVAVAAAGGLVLSIFVTLGNFPVLGWMVGNAHSGLPTYVNGHPQDLAPVRWNWSFADLWNAYANVASPNGVVLSTGSQGIEAFWSPLTMIAVWCVAAWLAHLLILDRTKMTPARWAKHSLVGGGMITGVAFGELVAFSQFQGAAGILVIGIIPAMLCATAAGMVLRETFQAYFTSKLGGTAVGTRIAEMATLHKVSFEMVGGLGDVKADIKESMIIPLMRKDVTSKFGLEPPKGILLFGPPGCGKTMLMKALANELGVEMISVKCSDLMSKWYGESEGKVAELFKTAKERAPCILFMDEVDALAKRRDMYSADDVSPRLLSIMLSEMDGMDKTGGVIIVATTNKPEMIDPAMMRPGRLDKIIYVPPPDFNERADVIKVHLFGKPVSPDIDLTEIAKKTERFSGADLANLVREAATIAMKRSMMTGVASIISMEDFRTVMPRIKPSISLRMIEEYERLKMDFERKMHQVQRAERKVVVKWDDVGGLEDIKKALKEYVELPLTKPELMEEYKLKTGRGILLFGPPGCGKTHIMRAASNELNVPIQIVNGPELVSALAGQSEAAVRDILYRARENSPSIVFFDEIDALASKESMKTPEVSRAVSQFLTEMDGIKPKDRVIIVATTNRPQILDPALLRPGRFDKIFYVPPPDLKARSDIFKIHLKGVPTDGEVDYDLLALGTEGYSGADIASIVDEAKLIALREQLRNEMGGHGAPLGSGPQMQLQQFLERGAGAGAASRRVIGVKMANLLEAIGKTKSSVTPETLEWAQSFIQTYGTRQ